MDILKSALGASLWYRIRPCKSISVTSEPTFAPWIAIKCGSTVMRNFAGSLSCSRPVLLLELDLVDELDFALFELLDFAELELLDVVLLDETATELDDFSFFMLEELLFFAELLDFAELDDDAAELLNATALLDEDFALMELLLDPIATLQDDEDEFVAEDDEEERVAEDDDERMLEDDVAELELLDIAELEDEMAVLELEDDALEELTYMFFVQKVSGSSMNAFANF